MQQLKMKYRLGITQTQECLPHVVTFGQWKHWIQSTLRLKSLECSDDFACACVCVEFRFHLGIPIACVRACACACVASENQTLVTAWQILRAAPFSRHFPRARKIGSQRPKHFHSACELLALSNVWVPGRWCRLPVISVIQIREVVLSSFHNLCACYIHTPLLSYKCSYTFWDKTGQTWPGLA